MHSFKTVSAYHNYMVDGRLQAEFRVEGSGGFFFHAHRLEPGGRIPVVSGRFFDPKGQFLVEVNRNVLIRNPHGFSFLEMRGAWAIMSTDLQAIVSAQVMEFPRGLVSIIRGSLHDALGCKVVFGDELGLHQGPDSQSPRKPLVLPGPGHLASISMAG
ncbi:MAG: hypothetical protein WHX93_17005 [bacterium]